MKYGILIKEIMMLKGVLCGGLISCVIKFVLIVSVVLRINVNGMLLW